MAIRRCVNCGHNIRDEEGNCVCELDDHTIGYVENFEFWCRRWKKDHKFDGVVEE